MRSEERPVCTRADEKIDDADARNFSANKFIETACLNNHLTLLEKYRRFRGKPVDWEGRIVAANDGNELGLREVAAVARHRVHPVQSKIRL